VPLGAGGAVPALLRCMQSPHRGLAKEASWAVSNIAGSPGRSGVDALVAAGGAAVITKTLKEAAFDIRKEAAYAVANICAGELGSVLCSARLEGT
jgi:importin subunit alpha-6/7